MQLLPLNRIRIPPNRQRGAPSPEAVEKLAASIRESGLIHPLLVEGAPDGYFTLVAGETRLRALQALADFEADLGGAEGYSHGNSVIPFTQVPCTLVDDLSPLARFRLELEENLRRTALPWQQQTAAIAKLAELKAAEGASGRNLLVEVQTELKSLSSHDTPVRALNVLHQDILLGKHLGDADVAKTRSREEALKVIERKLRKEADLVATSASTSPFATPICGDCLAVLASLPAASFEAVLSDPPYGIGITQFSTQHSSEQEYVDTYEHWQRLLPAVIKELSRVLKPDAAGYFFCDFTRFNELQAMLVEAGFEVYPRPFIWDRSPDGRLTTPEKWPRRVYECIVFFRRGSRPLFEVGGDVLSWPANRDSSNYHGAKKPVDLLTALLRRICRPGDAIVDPFAGSGTTAIAATRLRIYCTAIEQDVNYFGLMQRLLAGTNSPQEEFDL